MHREELSFHDFGNHPGEFFLNELVRGDGLIGKLFASFGVLQGGVVAGHGCADGAPADAITSLIEAAERTAEASDAGKKVFFGDFTIAKRKAACNGGAERPFSVNVPGLEARCAFFDQEATDFFVFAFCPDNGDIGDGTAGNPHFLAVEDVLVSFFDGASEHTAGVGSELRFGEAEAADGFALLQEREPFIFLRITAEGVNRVHDERALHGDEAAESGIATLKFLRHEAVSDVGHARATVTLEIRAKKAEFAELWNEMHRKCSFPAVFFDDGDNFVFDEFARGLAHQFLFVVELGIEIDEVHTAVLRH